MLSFFSPPPQSYSWLKPYLGCFFISAIAFYLTKFIYLIDSDAASIGELLGITLGVIAKNRFSLQIILVEGLIAVIILTLIMMLLTLPLSTSLFETVFAFFSLIIIAMAMTISAQWLIKHWICGSWGKFYGTIVSAIMIALGIILQSLSDLFLM